MYSILLSLSFSPGHIKVMLLKLLIIATPLEYEITQGHFSQKLFEKQVSFQVTG